MDDKQIQERKPGYGKATVVDVLYADDCVLFANTIREMQTMVICFDEAATIFGMELAIVKTKVVCNHFSKAMSCKQGKMAQGQRRSINMTPEAVEHYWSCCRTIRR